MNDHADHAVRRYLGIFAALLVLLGLTVGVAIVQLGAANIVVALAIAIAKALLVAWVFMHLRSSTPVVILFALGGVFWLVILILFTAADFLAR
ncbi:MAG: cytochrome C oxidase subunit IV family protein [Phycisphaerales bacterium]|nr:cytochrome C oxidase subunit IV family protein [Phycisphaerales bacterium]